MKLSKIFICAIAAAATFTSCIDRHEITPASDTKVTVDYQSVKPFDTVEIQAQQGKIAYAMLGNDTIAATTESCTIQIPKMQGRSRASEMVVEYKDYDGTYVGQCIYYTLMFEDSPGGDNDYNDLVVHVKQDFTKKNSATQNSNLTIQVQGIAMGNTLKLRLGADVYYCDENNNILRSGRYYFSNDVKASHFGVSTTEKMINTTANGSPLTVNKGIGTSIADFSSLDGNTYSAINWRANGTGMLPALVATNDMVYFNWFIENEKGERYYTVPSYLTGTENWISKAGYPIGLEITKARDYYLTDSKGNKCGLDWVNFPTETTNIETMFPGFTDWIEGKAAAPDWDAPVEGTYIDAIGNYGGKSLFDLN